MGWLGSLLGFCSLMLELLIDRGGHIATNQQAILRQNRLTPCIQQWVDSLWQAMRAQDSKIVDVGSMGPKSWN